MGGGRGISLRGERAKTHNEGEHGFSENRRPRVLETPDPTFFTVEKVTPSRPTTRTSQGSPPSDAFFPVDLPHPARGAHSSLEGPPGALGDPPQATPLGGPGPRCAARMATGRGASLLQAWLLLGKGTLRLLLAHIPEPRKLQFPSRESWACDRLRARPDIAT